MSFYVSRLAAGDLVLMSLQTGRHSEQMKVGSGDPAGTKGLAPLKDSTLIATLGVDFVHEHIRSVLGLPD